MEPLGDLDGPDLWSDYECRAVPPDVTACSHPAELGADYAYLLGLYLGDGCLSLHPRNVWRLRIFQDARYRGLVEECVRTVRAVADRDAGQLSRQGCTEIYCFWKHWFCLFPQQGPGRKHHRDVSLRAWQMRIVKAHPWPLLRGLVHSDGSRSINRVHRPTLSGMKEYRYVRYFFTNESVDIRSLFTDTCARVGVSCRRMTHNDISIARQESVRLMDEFIGPKA